MNRKERRAAAARKLRFGSEMVQISDIDSMCDIQVDGKLEQARIVMIWANSKGRKVVEDLWPDVEWTTDEIFSRGHSPEWMFTHLRIFRLPAQLVAEMSPHRPSIDTLGFIVAAALQRRTEPKRVVYYTGEPLQLSYFADMSALAGIDTALIAEGLPPGPAFVPSEPANHPTHH